MDRGRRGTGGGGFGRSNREMVDWLPWSVRCAAANCAAAPVGMTKFLSGNALGRFDFAQGKQNDGA